MERTSIAKPWGTGKIGDIVQGLGMITEVFQQGDKDICIVEHGNFGKINQVVQQKIVEQPVIQKPVKKQKIKVAQEAKNKQILDESPDSQGKMLLRG